MMKLNQIIALVVGRKARATKLLTEIHRGLPSDAVSGLAKTYTPKDEAGEVLPAEHKMPPVNVGDRLKAVGQCLEKLYQVVGSQERGNRQAQADVKLPGFELLGVPVTLLLFLEKQLTDLRTLVNGLPVLPADREWDFNRNRNCYVTEPIETLRSKKVPKVIVRYAATKEHPAQTELLAEDMTVGTWATVYMSTAIPATDKAAALDRLEGLQEAVKTAREAANMCEAEDDENLATVLDFVFGPLIRRVQS